MEKVTRAWVYIPIMGISSRNMKVEDIVSLCQKHKYGIWDGDKVVDASEFQFERKKHYLTTYGLFESPYFTDPSVTIVPFGTTLEYGRFIYPKDNCQ